MKLASMASILTVSATMALAAGLSAAGLDKVVTPWSFNPLLRPALPQVDGGWVKDDLDRFVLAGLTERSLKPSVSASRATLIRRASIDLHGLLPTRDEIEAFERDLAPDDQAFAKVVDRLLQSPRFGERWGRHWLDVVRYADSVGRSWNAPLIHAFRYRDYVIDAFNADKPYNRFVAEQIAGDLLPVKSDAERKEAMIATGMLGLGCMDLTAGQRELFAMDRIDDQIDVVSRSFLGLTLACARCHDHKTDPVTQHDYYALAGMFYSSRTWSGTASRTDLGKYLYVDPTRLFKLSSLNGKGLLAATARPSVAQDKPGEINAMDDMTSMSQMEPVKGGPGRFDYDPDLVMAVTDDPPRDCPIRIGGDPFEEDKTPHRGDLQIPKLPAISKPARNESGRLQLAQWITTPTHPLTARVMVNRVWQHLFGAGLVRTVDDFGITGEKPSQPALLDHLAVRFVVDGWSVKKLIRNIMLSATYRQTSASNPEGREIDPDNEMLWRMSPRRIEMEVLRDTMLQVAGRLKYERPAGIQLTGNGGKGNTGRTRSLLDIDSPYRTVYLPVLRDLLPTMYDTWDFANPAQIKGQRDVTTVPAQGLFMMNNAMVVDCAGDVAWQILEDRALNSDADRIGAAYVQVLGRQPSPGEIDDAGGLLKSLQSPSDLKDPELYRWTALVQALLGSAEFRYVL